MTARALLWELLKHVLHGGGKHEVLVYMELPGFQQVASGQALVFSWPGGEDTFCTIEAAGHLEPA